MVLSIDATTSSVCSITGGAVSFATAGTCTVDANQAGDTNYTAAPLAQQTFAVGKGLPDGGLHLDGAGFCGARWSRPTPRPPRRGPSGNPVVVTVDASASSVCSISGGAVSFTAAGTCTLDANQAGNS